MGRRLGVAAALATLALAALVACTSGGQQLATSDVVAMIPWPAQEEAVYRLLDGDELIGTGVLHIQREGEMLQLTQEFDFPERGFTDTVVAVVDAQTLKPRTVERVIVGPEGDRRWDVRYTSSVAEVKQVAGDDERTDRLGVPLHSYDSWSDLMLWRTIDFRKGYEASYIDMLTATLDKPQQKQVTLEVVSRETVEVPAGVFEVWRLEMRSSGRKQTAWYATGGARALVRYDNGSLLFELEELR